LTWQCGRLCIEVPHRASFMWDRGGRYGPLCCKSVIISLIFRSTRNTRLKPLRLKLVLPFAAKWRHAYCLSECKGWKQQIRTEPFGIHNLLFDAINSTATAFPLDRGTSSNFGRKGKTNHLPWWCTKFVGLMLIDPLYTQEPTALLVKLNVAVRGSGGVHPDILNSLWHNEGAPLASRARSTGVGHAKEDRESKVYMQVGVHIAGGPRRQTFGHEL